MMFQRLIFVALFALANTLFAGESVILDQNTRDWSQVNKQAASTPLILLVTSEDCGYCKMLKREVLRPMHGRGELESRALVREMDLDTPGKIIDFDGERVRAGIFLGRYKVFATPTVLFLDRDGNPLHEPLVGFNGSENYRPLLEAALSESQVALEQITDAPHKMADKLIDAKNVAN